MKLTEFNYDLPQELIAQYPLKKRADARLLVIDRKAQTIRHCGFGQITDYIEKDHVLVLNNTKVFKARMFGHKETGGEVEILLVKEIEGGIWEAMISHAKRIRENIRIFLEHDVYATVIEKKGSRCHLKFNTPVNSVISQYGQVPLPHYIKRDATESDEEYYQSVFAKKQGSIAAPTAGLHFTEEVFDTIRTRGATVAEITLHIGPGTFKPVRTDSVAAHKMEAEYFDIPDKTIQIIKDAQSVIGVGTSVCRALENFANTGETSGQADLFIYPGYKFKSIDRLVTNFHLPCSTPLLLVCAFAGKDLVFEAYEEAIEKKYRFLSYGDAMLIV